MKHYIICCLALLTAGCGPLAKVEVNVIGERTALENQVLGTYNALDRDMLMVASVRGVDVSGAVRPAPRHSREHEDAVAAMQLLDFHGDDIRNMKQLGWVGENREGLLTSFDMRKQQAPDDLSDFANRISAAEFDMIVRQTNAARKVIMQRVIDMNDNLGPGDLPRVRGIFADLNAEKALAGDKIQAVDGSWRIKAEENPDAVD